MILISFFFYSKAIKKYKIDDVKHYIQDVNKTEADDSTPLMKGLIKMNKGEIIIFELIKLLSPDS